MSAHLTTDFVAREMEARGYRVIAGPVVDITGGTADSRQVAPGDLFCAFPGERTHGDRFVADALAAGAVAAICSTPPDPVPPGKTIVVAPDTTRAVGELARAWRLACGPRVVGVTGTVGKTTAKDLAAAALSRHFRVFSRRGNYNSREGLPLALLGLRRDHEVAVLEIAMDTRGEIAYLAGIALPEIGGVMNVGLTHVEKVGSIEAIAEEKLSLARALPADGTAILNMDDPRIAPEAARLACRVIGFGRPGPGVDLAFSGEAARSLEGSTFIASFRGETVTVQSPLPGLHTIPAALFAIAAGIALGLTFPEAAAAVSAAELPERRITIRRSDTGATLLDDRYNSSPASLAGALRLLAMATGGRRIAFLGKMAELGEHEEAEHRAAGRIAAECCDILFAIGETCRSMAEEARALGHPDVRWFDDKYEAARALRELLGPGDTVLLKASRSQAFEDVIPLLEGEP
ncbi:UDP-N-acetylmuramoyl-tripeptide--D-alanyl-D-alanine ligase [Tepidiforma sp.]|uniref:UDP-N-acetylmuramoyl-tripeptide--D-alanyl-D- alanine ligase n=1 Tax=Tepidiforma sp. TaxID=2682230 RepID=UPI002ADDC6FA|nr:UDP-N-acetylmuramoyl-tripeptide--D-alanyl-D-alanine ligase [Tepidiforma sp.]